MIFFSTSITPAIPSVKAGLSLNKNWRVWNKNNDKHSICSAGFIENFSISLSGSCGRRSFIFIILFVFRPLELNWADTQEYIAHNNVIKFPLWNIGYLRVKEVFSQPQPHIWQFQTSSTSSPCCRRRPRPASGRMWSWAAPRPRATRLPLWGGAREAATWISHRTTGSRL